jgi:hypothetical protein
MTSFKSASHCVRHGHQPGKPKFEGYEADGRFRFVRRCARCRTVVVRILSAQPLAPGEALPEHDSGVLPMGLPVLEGYEP